jgi:predicted benzoate:H+ symporter BenE
MCIESNRLALIGLKLGHPKAGDVIFLCTVSEISLLGIAAQKLNIKIIMMHIETIIKAYVMN